MEELSEFKEIEDHPSNIKEEAIALNPVQQQSSGEMFVNPPKLSQILLVSANEENPNHPTPNKDKQLNPVDKPLNPVAKPLNAVNVLSESSPNSKDKPKKQIGFQNLKEDNQRDSKGQEYIKDKRQSIMPSRARGNSPVKSPEKEVDVFKVKDEVKTKKLLMVENFLESKMFQVPVTLLTIYALFFGDIKYLISTKSSDDIFDAMTFICMAVFTMEIILSTIAKKNYTFSFFFWLDIISTATLIFDLSMVSTKIFGNSTSLARASRATKIGSRAGRVIRLIRLIRIVKLWKSIRTQENKKILGRVINDPELISPKNFRSPVIRGNVDSNNNSVIDSPSRVNSPNTFIPSGHQAKPSMFQIKVMPVLGSDQEQLNPNPVQQNFIEQNAPANQRPTVMSLPPKLSTVRSPSISPSKYSEWDRIKDEPEEPEETTKESRVGKKLSELTTKRVVILVLVLIFIVPLFQSNYYFDDDKAYTIGIKTLATMSESANFRKVGYNDFMSIYTNYTAQFTGLSKPLAYVYLPNYPQVTYVATDPESLRDDEKEITAIYVSQYADPFTAVLDLREYVQLSSIINIMRTIFVCIVLTMAAYYFTKDATELALKPIERMIEKVNRIASNPLASKEEAIKEDVKGEMQMETNLIENAIIKIGTLLALGFGDAGSEIIASNMEKGGDVDPMMAGKKKCAVFGFCDIRSFTDATEVLQEGVMLFVNSIAEIVHKTVDKYGGAANKNIGDAFLLVYKFPEESIIVINDGDGTLDIKRDRITKNVADLSVISFLKIISGINKKPQVMKYRYNEKLCARMPNYKVKMGFGLHFGWAIEGAIGSEFKIDASYLSPNVNMASRLEAATKQYGVPLLISNDLHRVLSKKTQRYCREIDRVTVKGSKKPTGLYTIDVDIGVLIPSEEKGYTKRELKEKHKLAKSNIMESVFSEEDGIKASSLFDIDKDLLKMTENVFGVFRNTFSEAFDNYVKGDWGACKSKLDLCFNQRPEDGPSMTLMGVLKESNYMAPTDWQGFRVLTDK